MKMITHATIYDFEEFKTDQYILFDTKIKEVGPMSSCPPFDGDTFDATGSLVMPGLINGHTHIYSTFARGLNVPFSPKNFVELLEQLWWKLDRNITNDISYYSAIVSAVDSIKNGVTTLIDHHASGEITGSLEHLYKAIQEAHMRGVFCFETSDRFNVDEAIQENITFYNQHKTDQVRALFGLHASFTLCEGTLAKIGKLINNIPIHIHVGESKMDQDDSLIQYNETVIERLMRHNILHKNAIIAHGIQCTDEDLNHIHNQEAVIAVNVTSNMNNSVGLPDIKRFLKHKIPVIVGNDGISTSMAFEYEVLYFAMHHFYQSPTVFTFDDLKTLITNTYGYASRLFDIKIGKIQQGYVSDMVVIPYNPPTPLTKETIFGHLLFGVFHQFKPRDVFINGTQVLDNYNVVESLQKSYNEAHIYAKKCWNQIQKEGQL